MESEFLCVFFDNIQICDVYAASSLANNVRIIPQKITPPTTQQAPVLNLIFWLFFGRWCLSAGHFEAVLISEGTDFGLVSPKQTFTMNKTGAYSAVILKLVLIIFYRNRFFLSWCLFGG